MCVPIPEGLTHPVAGRPPAWTRGIEGCPEETGQYIDWKNFGSSAPPRSTSSLSTC